MITALSALAAGVAVAVVAGRLLHRRSGAVRATDPASSEHAWPDSEDLGLSDAGPTVVHFSATWCGPCAAARRVIAQACADAGGVAHTEIDIDANPTAARRLSVLSLPTTFIFDRDGRRRYRAAGVPGAAELRSALTPLLD